MKTKLRVVLLCHYWSTEAESMIGKKNFFRELSPWIQERINLFKNKEDIELHIVAPNYTSNKNVECTKDNIHFHFYHYAPNILSKLFVLPVKLILKHEEPHKIAERCANTITEFRTVTKSVETIVNRIHPDLIHVFGTEFPDSSAGAISLVNKYPTIITIQGYAYMVKSNGYYLDKKFQAIRTRIEKIINTTVKYRFCAKGREFPDEFKPFENGQKPLVDGGNITRIPKVNAEMSEKIYDIAFFGRVSADKGVEDLVHAVGLLHKKYNLDLRTIIIGKCTVSYQKTLESIVKEYGALNLLSFTGFVEDHEEVYNIAAKALMVVLPTRVDLMPNTIRESIAMGEPVVASDAGYIPTLNRDQESVAIHKVCDVADLAEIIKKVYLDKEYRQMLIDNGRKTFEEQYSMKYVYERTIEVYQQVYSEWNAG